MDEKWKKMRLYSMNSPLPIISDGALIEATQEDETIRQKRSASDKEFFFAAAALLAYNFVQLR